MFSMRVGKTNVCLCVFKQDCQAAQPRDGPARGATYFMHYIVAPFQGADHF